MATVTWNVANDASSDATWRTWGSAFHTALAGLGTLVQTADSGQANWATATRSPGAYEMWAMADALQSSAPYYIRFLFDQSANAPRVWISIGTGTDGAGNLTGNVSTARAYNCNSTATALTHYLSSTTSRLTGWLFVNGSAPAAFTIERARSNTGAEIGTGAMHIGNIGVNGTGSIVWVSAGAALPAVVEDGNCKNYMVCSRGGTLIGTQMTCFTFNPVGPNYQVQNPPVGLLLYHSSDLGLSGTLPQITMYGTARTYINVSNSPSNFGKDQITDSLLVLMLNE